MRNVNSVAIVGRLARDPEIRFFGSGAALLTFTLRFNQSKKNGDAWEDTSGFVDVKQFKPNEKFVALLHKDSLIGVQGRIEQEEWNDKTSGAKRSKVVIFASDIMFVAPKGAGEPKTQETQETLAPIDGTQGTIPLDQGEDCPF